MRVYNSLFYTFYFNDVLIIMLSLNMNGTLVDSSELISDIEAMVRESTIMLALIIP